MANNQLIASDNFASGSLAAGWSPLFSVLKSQVIVGSPNVVEPNTVGVASGQVWTGAVWPNDQTSELTIKQLTQEVGTQIVLAVRTSSSAFGGYLGVILNGGATIYLYNANGSVTSLATAGVTIASGDVWALQAAGSCISLYQNGNRIAYFYDTTWASGVPGFDQLAAVNVNHNQVSSWRGYSAVQQDGIWQKQGIVIAPNAADLALSSAGIQITALFREANAQLLSGTVFKTWLVNNWATTSNVGGVYYLESVDGISWTRRTAPVLTGYTNFTVFKNGSTYYGYCQTNAGNGHGTIQVFTSPDGLNWTLQTPVQTISQGPGGAWDSNSIYEIIPIDVVNGTWYGMYTGQLTVFQGGLVTSTDGINWVKYAGNPVIPYLPISFAKVGSVYYGWFAGYQVGLNSGNALDPTEVIRYQTTDFINWTNPVNSLHHTQMFESLNANTGQVFSAGTPLDVNGRAYLWYNANQKDGFGVPLNQIGLAIGPAPLASIVQQREDGTQQVASDAFTNGPGGLSANWVTPPGVNPLQIVPGSFVESTVAGVGNNALYTGASFSNDHYSEVTIRSMVGATDFVLPTVRASVSAFTFYTCNVHGPIGSVDAVVQMAKVVAGVQTLLGPTAQVTPQVGDVLRLSVVTGSDGFPVLSFFQNGILVLQVQDFANILATGKPGMGTFANTILASAQLSAWAGGNAGIIPLYNVQISGNTGGIPGVTVSWTGPSSGSTVSGPGGTYVTPNLAPGSYVLVPSAGFSPVSVVVVLNTVNVTGVNFSFAGTFVEGLYSLLIADPGVQGILGLPANRRENTTGIFPNVAPDEVSMPYVVFSQVHRDVILSFQGVNRVHSLRFQLSCYGPSYKAAKSLAIQVKNLLDGFVGSLPNFVYVFHTSPVSEHDEIEPVFKGTVYGTILDYLFVTNGA